jgi:hypothetical protein
LRALPLADAVFLPFALVKVGIIQFLVEALNC